MLASTCSGDELGGEQRAAFVEPALQADDEREVLPDLAGRAGHLHRPAQVRLGRVELVGHRVGEAEIGFERGLVRRDRQRLLVELPRFLVAAHLVEDRALDRGARSSPARSGSIVSSMTVSACSKRPAAVSALA